MLSRIKPIDLLFIGLAVGLGLPSGLYAQNFDDVVVSIEQVRDNVYVVVGAGGNIGLSIGSDGPLLIDDQFAPLTDKIRAAIRTVSPAPVRFVVNTHHHGDHSGGNANFAGGGATVVAHDNVRRRIQAAQDAADESNPAALPVITFSTDATFHWNEQTTLVHHVQPAHTDGDAIVTFEEANVVHMGDTFFATGYPYVDLNSGGDIDGVIAAADYVLSMANAQTIIIPGHGPISTPDDLRTYRDMLMNIRDSVASALDRGQSSDQIIAARPSADFDEIWGKGFINPDRFVTSVINSLKAK